VRYKNNQNKILIYQSKTGALELRGDFKRETIWATQEQIVRLFEIDQSVVSRHINNIFKDGEVDRESNMQKMHIANSDKPVAFYSLDLILAVGYRANSARAIEFRQEPERILAHFRNDCQTAIFSPHRDAFRYVLQGRTTKDMESAEATHTRFFFDKNF